MEASVLARLEHANLIATMSLFVANAEGAVVRRADGLVVASSGLPFLLFNQVIVEDNASPTAALGAAVDFMRQRGAPFVVNLRVGADDAFAAAALDLGLVALSERPWMPGMAMSALPTEASGSAAPDGELPGFEIRRAIDASGVEDHIRTAAAGFDMDEALIRAIIVVDLLDREDVAIYVGYADGTPVATGLGFRTPRTIGIYNIATVERGRGRGYGASMTRRVVADGASAGCDVAILQSSEMGYPIYERLGLRTVVEYMAYIEPPVEVRP